MSAFHLSVSDNMKSFKNWHERSHILTAWESCPHEPCKHMDPEFRRCWK